MLDRQSQTWRWLEKHIDARLATLTQALEQDIEPIETARIRGQIAELRKILHAASPAAPEEPVPTVSY